MEIVNIEAGTFGRMNAALEELVGKLQSERKDKEKHDYGTYTAKQ
ncbi:MULTISPECIES: hypothetical protein [Bacteroidaceae]|nr:hypothetical protein [Bacteroides stercoris]